MCFIIIHKVIMIKEMKMNLFLQKLFFCPVYQLSVSNETAPRSPNPPPPPPPPPFVFLRKAFLAPAVAKFQSIIESLQQFYLTGYNFGFLVLETLSHVT